MSLEMNNLPNVPQSTLRNADLGVVRDAVTGNLARWAQIKLAQNIAAGKAVKFDSENVLVVCTAATDTVEGVMNFAVDSTVAAKFGRADVGGFCTALIETGVAVMDRLAATATGTLNTVAANATVRIICMEANASGVPALRRIYITR